MKSIISNSRKCYFCGSKQGLEWHHCMGGSNRRAADKYGLVVMLCPDCHRGKYGVHGAEGADKYYHLKRVSQRAFEAKHSHADWMAIFGKNYI